MTKLYVAEFTGLARTENEGNITAFNWPPTITGVLDFSTGTPNYVFQPTTRWALLCADAGCSIKVSTSAAPVNAAVTDWRLPANTPIPLRVVDGSGAGTMNLSAISNA